MKNIPLKIQEIVYLQASESYSFMVLANGDKVLKSRPLKHYIAQFELEGWVRIHRSFLVNPIFVKNISEDREFLYMKDGIELPIARRKLKLVSKWRLVNQ